MRTQNIKRYLNSFGKEVVRNAKRNLSLGKRGGGNLEQSLKYKIISSIEGFEVEFYMAEYGAYMDKGVKGAGGEIKSGKHKGNWGGRRWYRSWEGQRGYSRKDSPFQFGSGKGKGSIYKGIESFIKSKGIKGRDSKTGRFITNKSLAHAIVRVLWIKGIHGISFFQDSLRLGLQDFGADLLKNVSEDIVDDLSKANTLWQIQ